jgi:tetratricopeptide (TPR) repeat protein
MRKRADPQRQRSYQSHGSPRSDLLRAKRWPLVAAIAVCAAVGAALLERWSRPIDRAEPGQAVPPIRPPEKRAKPPAVFSLPTSDQELIVETKKIGNGLAEDFPEDPAAITLAGHICWAFDEPAKAVAAWEKCTRLHPQFIGAWTSLGMDAFKNGDFEKAGRLFQNAYRRSSAMSEGNVFMMTDALMNTGKAAEVVSVLEPLRKTYPASVRAALTLGQAYLQLKEYEKAKKELLAALAMDPALVKAHFALAQAFARLGDEPNARRHRDEYAKLKTTEAAAQKDVRTIRLKTELIEVPRQAARFLTWTAEIYQSHGRVGKAEQLWVTSFAVDPANVDTRRDLEMLYSAQGRDEEAREISRGASPDPKRSR